MPSTDGGNVTIYKTIKVGKPLKVDDLKRKPAPRGRQSNPRDVELARLVNEVSVGPSSDVIPWQYEGKPATARAAAIKVIKASGASVYVSSRPDHPGILLFSRVPLSGRQGKKQR
jgi:hypothetical protein